jgi:hypothetical protein
MTVKSQTHDQLNEPPLDLEDTGSQKLFDKIIHLYFIPFEIWYIRTIMDKASIPPSE